MGILEKDFEKISESSIIDYNAFRDKTFLITGATGLIGSLCIKALLYVSKKKNLNIHVYAVIRDKKKAEYIFSDSSKPEYICMDLMTDAFLVDSLKVDYIIHAASITNSKRMISNPVDTILTALHGTEKILDFAVKNHVASVVYVSSMEVYGTVEEGGKAKEDILGFISLDSIRSSYPESKRMCECMCKSYVSQYGLQVTCARLAQTFGAGILETENRVFVQFAKSAMKGENIVLHTTGESEGNYVYSADAIIALLFLLQNGVTGESYNINNEDSHCQIHEMAEMVAKDISGSINVVYEIPEDSSQLGYAPTVKLHLSSGKINSLGWHATVSLREAYLRMIQYMTEMNFV